MPTMPTEAEYQKAATKFRSLADSLDRVPKEPNEALPKTKLESTFRDYFDGRLGEFTATVKTTSSALRAAARECDRRAVACGNYTDGMRVHRMFPNEVNAPPRTAPWIQEG